MPESLVILNNYAQEFRDAINHLKLHTSKWDFPNYPHKMCGAASSMLKKYLREKGLTANYYYGQINETFFQGSHAWVQVGDLCVDLTADQFIYAEVDFPEVIVVPFSDYPLRKYLSEVKMGEIDMPPLNSWLIYPYSLILEQIRANKQAI